MTPSLVGRILKFLLFCSVEGVLRSQMPRAGRGEMGLHCGVVIVEIGQVDKTLTPSRVYNSLPMFEDDLEKLLLDNSLRPFVIAMTPISNVNFSQPNYVGVVQKVCRMIPTPWFTLLPYPVQDTARRTLVTGQGLEVEVDWST